MTITADQEIFGPLIIGTQIEEAFQEILEKWLPTYLGVIDRKLGKGEELWLPEPQSYTISSDWDHFPEEATPAILIMTKGIEDTLMDGLRNYRGKFHTRVGVFAETSERKTTEQLAKYFAAAIRLAVLQHGNLEKKVGEFVATAWKGEDYGVHISDRSQRTFGSAEVRFSTEVREIVRRGGGLLKPSTTPQKEPPKWPVVREEPSPPVIDPEKLSENVETE